MTPGSTTPSTSTAPKPRKQRKRSERYSKGCAKKPSMSARFKELWADPVWREKTLAAQRAGLAAVGGRKARCRRGVPDGMCRLAVRPLWEKAQELADRFIKIMEEKGLVEEIVIPGSEEEMGKEALREAFKMAVGPVGDIKTKTANIRTVLEWTKAKPESKSKLTLNKAEDFLAEIAQDMGDAK